MRYNGLLLPAAALLLIACNAVRAELSDGNGVTTRSAVTASTTARPQDRAGEGAPEPTATPTPEPDSTITKPKKKADATPTPTPSATPTPTATPAKRSTAALTDQIPDCEDLLDGAHERFRQQISSTHNGRGADAVTLECRTDNASIAVTVTRFTHKADAERGDSLLKRSSPFNLKDRTLNLDGIAADVVGGMIMPDEMGGLVTVGLRKGLITVSIAAHPTSYGKHVEDEATTLATTLAGALG